MQLSQGFIQDREKKDLVSSRNVRGRMHLSVQVQVHQCYVAHGASADVPQLPQQAKAQSPL
jgi:hypothetical protein